MTLISTINRAITANLTSLTEYLVCSISNGDSTKQIIISYINYGYTSNNVVPPAFGWGAIHIFQSQEFRDGVLGYNPRQPDIFGGGNELFFDNTISYGSKNIQFTKRPIIAEPGFNVIVVMPAAIGVGGLILIDQNAFMTVLGDYVKTADMQLWQ